MVDYFGERLKVMEKLAYNEKRRIQANSANGFLLRFWTSLANRTHRIAATPLNLPNWSILKFQNVKITDKQILEVTSLQKRYFIG